MGMEPFVAADDNAFGHLIGSIPNPTANLQQALAFKVGLAGKQAEIEARRAEAEQSQAAASALAQKLTRAQEFQRDLATVQGSPDAKSVSSLIMKYPEFADQLKSGWDVKDNAAKSADLTQLGETYSAAASGNWDLAAKLAHQRYDADKAAGNADPSDEQFIQSLDAAAQGDEGQRKAVLTTLGTHIAAVSGPEHFASVYGALKGGYTLDAGATRYDDNGNVVAQSPFLQGADGTMYERDGHAGSSSTPTPAPAATDTQPGGEGGFERAVAFTLKHEGGYNAHDMNGAPVNFGINQGANPGVDVAKLTPDEAKQIYKTKYWDESGAANLPATMQTPYFDTYIINPSRARQFLKASGGDPGKFMQMREAWMGSVAAKNPQYAKAYATRNADLRLTMQGGGGAPDATAAPAADTAPPGYHTLIPGKPKPQRMPPDQVKAEGLNPDLVYYRDANGVPQPVGGQTGAGAVPTVPGDTSLSGPAYIESVRKSNPSLAAQVQGVLDTRLAYPPATSRNAQAQLLRAAVLQADPTYDEQAYKRRQTTVQQYTPGHTGPGQSMLSAATLINHMYDLAQAARQLPDHTTAAQNALSAWYANQTNQKWLIQYNEGRKFVASELPKFLEGKAPTEGQVREHYGSYSPSKGKSGIQSALATDIDYLYGRYQPLIQAYKDNVGKNLNLDTYAPGQATRAKEAALEYYRSNGALPTVITSPQQAAGLPHGALFVTPDGRVLRRH